MKRVARTNQGGSVVTFAIIGTILVLVLAGGMYYVYQRGEHARSGEPLIGSTEKKTTPSPSKSSDTNSHNTGAPNTNNSSSSQPHQTTGQSPSTGSDVATTPSQIPQTGPAHTASSLLAVLVLTLSGAYYIRSRASLRSL